MEIFTNDLESHKFPIQLSEVNTVHSNLSSLFSNEVTVNMEIRFVLKIHQLSPLVWAKLHFPTANMNSYIEGILPKGPYPPRLRMADRALLAGYPRYMDAFVYTYTYLHVWLYTYKWAYSAGVTGATPYSHAAFLYMLYILRPPLSTYSIFLVITRGSTAA